MKNRAMGNYCEFIQFLSNDADLFCKNTDSARITMCTSLGAALCAFTVPIILTITFYTYKLKHMCMHSQTHTHVSMELRILSYIFLLPWTPRMCCLEIKDKLVYNSTLYGTLGHRTKFRLHLCWYYSVWSWATLNCSSVGMVTPQQMQLKTLSCL